MPWPEPVTLRGRHATLAPLSQDYCQDLIESVNDGELFKLWYTNIPAPDKISAEIERRLKLHAAGSMLPFAVISNDTGKAVGMTTYMNIDPVTPRVEIGSTWYRTNVQRTGINTECKIMLLSQAFDVLNCPAVEFRTSFFNQQSRKAIERLGAKLDGILRNHSYHLDGTLRDTCVYSILKSEWPTVKSNLQFRLQ